jgi:acetyl esterase
MIPIPDRHMAPILERIRAAPVVDYTAMPMAQARPIWESLAAPWNEPRLPVASVRDLSIPGAAGEMRARLFQPAGAGPRPIVIFIHGGGWTFGSLESHDGHMRHLSHYSDCAVLGIEYRLAPEHPFPAPLDDIIAAIRFVRDGKLGGGIDAGRLALAGDSAGANLALIAMLHAKKAGEPPAITAALFYGCYAPLFDTGSHKRFGDGSFGLSTASMRWYWKNYLGYEPRNETGRAAPLHGDLSGLPPLYLSAAGLDPLLDDTLLMGQRLAEAGVRYRLDIFPGVTHGFLRMTRELPIAKEALKAGGAHLADALR